MNVFRACTGLGVFGFGDVGNQPFVNSKSPEGLIPLPSAEDIANFIESNGLTLTTFDTTRHFLGKDTIYDKKDRRNYDRLWFKIDEARRLLEKRHHGKFKSKVVVVDRKPRTIYFFEGREPKASAMGQVGMMKVAESDLLYQEESRHRSSRSYRRPAGRRTWASSFGLGGKDGK